MGNRKYSVILDGVHIGYSTFLETLSWPNVIYDDDGAYLARNSKIGTKRIIKQRGEKVGFDITYMVVRNGGDEKIWQEVNTEVVYDKDVEERKAKMQEILDIIAQR